MAKQKVTDRDREIIAAVARGETAMLQNLRERLALFLNDNPIAKEVLPEPASIAYLSRKMIKVLEKPRWQESELLTVCANAFMLALAMHQIEKEKRENEHD